MSGWILIAGYGSIGRRHYRNLNALGYDDVRLLRSGRRPPEGFETPPDTIAYDDLHDALDDGPEVVVVSNPSALHVPVTRAAVRAGACVLLEKPVCSNLEEARKLLVDVRAADGVCSMAYSFRYHPLYSQLAAMVREGRLGRVFHAHAWQAGYLPSWHPWENYRESYAAREDLGGGVVRTLDHDLDMVRWMLGSPSEVLGSTGSFSGIGVDVEDTADMIFRYPDRKQAHVHVCFGRRDYARGMWIVGEDASAMLDWGSGTLKLANGRQILEEITLPDGYDLNEIYVGMIKDALDSFANNPPRAAIPLSDGVAALEMGISALASSRSSAGKPLSGVEPTNITLKTVEETSR